MLGALYSLLGIMACDPPGLDMGAAHVGLKPYKVLCLSCAC